MPETLSDEREAVLSTIREAEAPIGPKAVHERTPGSSYGSVKNMLPALAEEGFLVRKGHGKYVFVTDDPEEASASQRRRMLEAQVPADTPRLPGGGPSRLGYLEEGARAGEPPDILLVIDFGGGTEVRVPVAVLGQGERTGPALRATARIVASGAPRTDEPEPRADLLPAD